MRYTLVLLISVMLGSGQLLAQELDAFKYIIVPKQFEFQRGEDRFQLNSLTKFLFDKKGFTTLMEGDRQPEDLRENPCLGAKANVLDNSGMLSTKFMIEILNCQNKVVFTSVEGKSKIKDKKRGQHDALRKAFRSVQEIDYTFDRTNVVVYEEAKPAVEPEESPAKPAAVELVEEAAVAETPKAEPEPETVSTEEPAPQVVTQETPVEQVKPVVSEQPKKSVVLYAQEVENGYQLVDNTPKIVFVALKSSQENRFYLKNKAGVLYKNGDAWYAEYYKDGVLITKELQIKF